MKNTFSKNQNVKEITNKLCEIFNQYVQTLQVKPKIRLTQKI